MVGNEPMESEEWVGVDKSTSRDMESPLYVLARTNNALISQAIKYTGSSNAICIDHIKTNIDKAIRTSGKQGQFNRKAESELSDEVDMLKRLGVVVNLKIHNQIIKNAVREAEVSTDFNVSDLKSLLENNVSEDKAEYVFMTVHESKGLTLPNVIFTGTTSFKIVDAVLGRDEFINIIYTAMTRTSGYFKFSPISRSNLKEIFPQLQHFKF
jgi:superfamily I DNA/RNA helicase